MQAHSKGSGQYETTRVRRHETTRDVHQPLFNDTLFFYRLSNCKSGTLAHGMLEMRFCRVALLSNHSPPLKALIIFLALDNGIFLLVLFKILRLFFCLLTFFQVHPAWQGYSSRPNDPRWLFIFFSTNADYR